MEPELYWLDIIIMFSIIRLNNIINVFLEYINYQKLIIYNN